MPTTLPITGTSIPVAGDSNNVPSDLSTSLGTLEKFVVAPFPSSGARAAAIPSPRFGMVSAVSSDGYLTYYDGTIWKPWSGQRITRLTGGYNGSSGTAVGPLASTAVLTVPSYPFPVEATINWAATFTNITPADQLDAQLWINNAPAPGPLGQARNSSAGFLDYSGTYIIDQATSAASFTANVVFYKQTGTGQVAVWPDSKMNAIDIIVRAL